MGCLKLTYYEREETLEKSLLFIEKGLEKNGRAQKKCVTGYRYGFNGMEKDDEIKGNGNSLDFGARIYDPRIGKFLSLDPRMSDFPFMSPYCYAANSPIMFIDVNGEGPDKKGAKGRTAYLKKITNHVTRTMLLDAMYKYYGGRFNTSNSANSEHDKNRYVYSTRWGWIDMKHFFAAAYHTDMSLISGDYVLSKGEGLERKQQKQNNASAYSYEDLVSNLMGVYFEEYLEDFKVNPDDKEAMEAYRLKGQAYVLEQFMKEIGIVDDETQAPNYKGLPINYENQTVDNVPKNETYTPKYTTGKRNKKIDRKIQRRLKKYKKSNS
jgi:RHS repeat-associated protein